MKNVKIGYQFKRKKLGIVLFCSLYYHISNFSPFPAERIARWGHRESSARSRLNRIFFSKKTYFPFCFVCQTRVVVELVRRYPHVVLVAEEVDVAADRGQHVLERFFFLLFFLLFSTWRELYRVIHRSCVAVVEAEAKDLVEDGVAATGNGWENGKYWENNGFF